jgi:hypothetical protein
MPGADEFQPIEDDVNQVLKSVESEGQQVFQNIANTVQDRTPWLLTVMMKKGTFAGAV